MTSRPSKADNDLLETGVLQALALHGVSVPDDVALVGHDDIEFARSAIVSLTSVRQSRAEIGAAAIDLLISTAEGGKGAPERICYRAHLVERASSIG